MFKVDHERATRRRLWDNVTRVSDLTHLFPTLGSGPGVSVEVGELFPGPTASSLVLLDAAEGKIQNFPSVVFLVATHSRPFRVSRFFFSVGK